MNEWKELATAPKDRPIEAINEEGIIKTIKWYQASRYLITWCCDIRETEKGGKSYRLFYPVKWRDLK